MGNNPVNGVDPDGGYSWFGAWWRSGFSSDIYKSGDEWGYNAPYADEQGIGVAFHDGVDRAVHSVNVDRAVENAYKHMPIAEKVRTYGAAADGILPDYTIESFILEGKLLRE